MHISENEFFSRFSSLQIDWGSRGRELVMPIRTSRHWFSHEGASEKGPWNDLVAASRRHFLWVHFNITVLLKLLWLN